MTRPADFSISVIPMRRVHLRQVLRIEREAYPQPWSFATFLSELKFPEIRHYLVAIRDGQVVGYGGMMRMGDEAHIANVAIDARYRRCGIGTDLVDALVRRSLEWGCDEATLEVRVSNLAAQQLYFKFGFAPVGVRKSYYIDNNEDAIIMTRAGLIDLSEAIDLREETKVNT